MCRHITLSVILLSVFLGGCGTKGPLTLPPKPAAPGASAPAQPAPTATSNDLNTAKEPAR